MPITKPTFHTLLTQHSNLLIIDGALATHLETQGHNLNTPLWSGHLLQNCPTAISTLHQDYYASGANIAITASYQTVPSNLQHHLNISFPEAYELISSSARLARSDPYAADGGGGGGEGRLVAGSIGPYGAYLADGSEYTGSYTLSKAELKDFHRSRMQALVEGGVDLLAVETFPKLDEVEAVLELLEEEFEGVVCWVSCTVKEGGKVLCDGTEVGRLCEVVERYRERVVAFGVNCVGIEVVSPFFREVRRWYEEKGIADMIPLLCYPNSGEVWDGENKTWSGVNGHSKRLCAMVEEWQSLGARLIGGCCRTGPNDIKQIAEVAKRVDSSIK